MKIHFEHCGCGINCDKNAPVYTVPKFIEKEYLKRKKNGWKDDKRKSEDEKFCNWFSEMHLGENMFNGKIVDKELALLADAFNCIVWDGGYECGKEFTFEDNGYKYTILAGGSCDMSDRPSCNMIGYKEKIKGKI